MVRSSLRRSTLLLSAIALLASLVATPASAAPPAGKGAPERHGGLLRGRRAAPGHRREVRRAGPACPRWARSSRTGPTPRATASSPRPRRTRAPAGTAWRPARGRPSRAPRTTRSTAAAPCSPNRTAAFDAGVLQAESIAQSAERGGLKVAQVEWAGGRGGTTQGPTIDYRAFLSGRGVATNFIGSAGDVLFDDAAFIAAFGLQFDHPAGYAGQAPFPGAAPTDATGWTNVPASNSPAKEMRLRVLDFGTDKYGQNAYIFDSTNDGAVNYDKVLFSPTKDGADAVATLAQGQWADVKVKIIGGCQRGQDRRHAAQGRGAERGPVAGPPVPHLGHPRRSQAGRPGPASPATRTSRSTSPRSSRRRPPRTTRSSRPASPAKRPTSSRGCTGPRPTTRCSSTSSRPTSPTSCWPATRSRTSSSTSSSASCRPSCIGGAPNPAYDDVEVDGVKDGRVAAREGVPPDRLRGGRRDPDPGPQADGHEPDDLRLVGPRLRAAVPGRRREQGARGPRPAVQAADVQLPPGHGRDHRQGQGLLGRRRRPGLPQPRRPRSRSRRGLQQVPGGCRRDRRPDQGRVPRPDRPQRLDP